MPSNTPSSIVCFKNGFSFVTVPVQLTNDPDKQDETDSGIQSCSIGPLPSFAVHGTVGLQAQESSAASVKIFSLSKAPKTVEELRVPSGPDFSYHAFLQANVGTHVRVQVKHGEENLQEWHGRIKWVQPSNDGPRMAILETSDHNVVKFDRLIDTTKIVHLERSGKNDQEDVNNSLLVRYVSAKETIPECILSYLTKGLTWAPSYSVLMSKESKTVKLEGKACLLCDLPFLDGDSIPEISLVAGEPNMEFQHLSDPLASGVSAEVFVDMLGGSQSRFQETRQVMMRSQAYAAAPMAMNSMAFDSVPEMEDAEGISGGESVGDFFHYNLKNVPLKYNHPLSIPFIEECDNITYEDVYYLDLDKVNNNSGRYNRDEKGSVEVKHAISFKNTSGQPLTTAPVSILAKSEDKNNKFLVQGNMKFTIPGKNATIEITKTMDVEGKFGVETKERKTEVISEAEGMFNTGKKQYVDVIKKVAKVLIKNTKDEEIKCKVEYQMFGHLNESTPDFKDKIEVNHHGLNPTTKYTWEVMVPAKEKIEINFQFCVKEWNHALNKAEK